MSLHGNRALELILVDTGARAAPLASHLRAFSANQSGTERPASQSLGELFAEVAARRGDASAFETTTQTWSYAELFGASRVVATTIAAHPAFVAGGRIVILLPNSAGYAAAFYGVILSGGIVVPLPPKIERGMLQEIVSATEATLILTTPELRRARADLQECAAQIIRVDSNASVADPQQPILNNAAHQLAAILFTAGSSGIPKGVMLSHDNLIANAYAIQEYLTITAGDRPLCVLPFHHAFGNSVLQSHLLAGAHLVVDGQTLFPETLIEALAYHKCTSLSGVPDLFRVMLERTSLGRTALPYLRTMAVAGGSLRRDSALEVARRISPARLFVMYGQTEATARLAYVPPEELAGLPEGAIGRSISGVTLEVVDEQDLAVLPGVIGELRAKGPGVMLGYWRDPAATTERIRRGWLYTGDLAIVDAEGSIVLKGRRNALVKIAGYRVHPADLEEFALRRLAVAQAVAVTYDAPEVGPRLALFLTIGEDSTSLTSSQAIARCRAELPACMVPELVQILNELPLNDAMKIDRRRLSRLAESEATRRRTPA